MHETAENSTFPVKRNDNLNRDKVANTKNKWDKPKPAIMIDKSKSSPKKFVATYTLRLDGTRSARQMENTRQSQQPREPWQHWEECEKLFKII